eukprot:TRINITY_DN26493_c0_g1_i1.p2 TRINITY_DN26493_c0_g1~~TRINITY_DN26493_c0_g1_i1.p2  ORF type:complete len:117 (+),score=20.16 TRINITY_DN26493_c0_g1_i1:34-384(+)
MLSLRSLRWSACRSCWSSSFRGPVRALSSSPASSKGSSNWMVMVGCTAGAGAGLAVATGTLTLRGSAISSSKDSETVDALEQRLQAELQRTSFSEWRASGFEPEAKPRNADTDGRI